MGHAEAHIEPERAWVEKARNGDPTAVAWIFERYCDRVYSYAIVRLADHAEAEDVTQQVFLKVMEKIESFEWQGSGFAAWLFRIAHNQVIDVIRRGSRHPHVPIDATDQAVLTSLEGDPHEYAERRAVLSLLTESITRLSELQAQVIMLRYAGGLSNREIAEVMSRTPNAINSLHYEALRKLEQSLTQKGYLP